MKRKLWEKPACNICKSKRHKTVYGGMTYWEYSGIFRIVQCLNCNLIFLSPRPVLSEMEKYYQQDNYYGRDVKAGDTYNDVQVRREAYGPVYDMVLKVRTIGSVFDIGAGTGLFLSELKERGWNVSGVELESYATRYAKRQYGIDLKHGDFFDFPMKKNSYDVVTLNGALEHLHDPLRTLKSARSLLKEDGVLILSVPNVASLGRIIFGKNWFPWQPPRHLYHFSPLTVRKLLQVAGYKKVNIKQNYYIQNSYILFNSLRYGKSPKFKKSPQGGLANAEVGIPQKNRVYIQIGKVMWGTISRILARVEPFIKRGEVMLVYAEKN